MTTFDRSAGKKKLFFFYFFNLIIIEINNEIYSFIAFFFFIFFLSEFSTKSWKFAISRLCSTFNASGACDLCSANAKLRGQDELKGRCHFLINSQGVNGPRVIDTYTRGKKKKKQTIFAVFCWQFIFPPLFKFSNPFVLK